MSRPALRLVQSLDNPLEFNEGKFEDLGIRQIKDVNAVHSHVQLYFTWPDYSSACAKINNEMFSVTLSTDLALAEIDQLFLTLDKKNYERVKENSKCLQRVYLEVFGVTFGFTAEIEEISEEFNEGEPNVALSIPSEITRYSMRGSKRIKAADNTTLSIRLEDKNVDAVLIDISPTAFSVKVQEELRCGRDRVEVTFSKYKFECMLSSAENGTVLLKPLSKEPQNFGPYFDLYCQFTYPGLKSRYEFPEDPIPGLLTKTGQAKKHAANEISTSWMEGVNAAYLAAKDARHLYTADYVVTAEEETPIGTSSIVKGYLDPTGTNFWAFHGVGVIQDPRYLDKTCMLYLWRADYVSCKDARSPIIVWFDGRGKWLEKVYTKFQRLTSDITKISAIRHNRYVRASTEESSESDSNLPAWKHIKTLKEGRFERTMCSDDGIMVGIGTPYLNYSGILNNVVYWQESPISESQQKLIQGTVDALKPDKLFVETPVDHSDLDLKGYEKLFIDATNRQCITYAQALPFFASSLEHSKAVVKKKYAGK